MKRNQFVAPKNPGLIRCTNAGDILKRHSQASLQMLFQNISPIGKPTATLCPSLSPFQSSARSASAGPLAVREGAVFPQSRASSLEKGFENTAQLGLPKHRPALLLYLIRSCPLVSPSGLPWQSTANLPRCLVVPIRVIRGSMLFSTAPSSMLHAFSPFVSFGVIRGEFSAPPRSPLPSFLSVYIRVIRGSKPPASRATAQSPGCDFHHFADNIFFYQSYHECSDIKRRL